MPRFATSKGQANQDQGGGNTKQGLPPSIGVSASLARLMSRKAFSNPVAVALARIFDNFDFIGGGIYDIVIELSHISLTELFTRIYFIGAFTLRLKNSSETLRTNIAVFNVPTITDNGESEYALVDWNPEIDGTGITAITAIAIDDNHVYLGISGANPTNAIQRFNIVNAVRDTPTGFVLTNHTKVNTIVLREDDVFVGANNLYVFNKTNGSAKYGTTAAGTLTLAAPDSTANDLRTPPSVRSIAFIDDTVYIGGHFKILDDDDGTVIRDGAAAYTLGTDNNALPEFFSNWNPAIKKNATDVTSENYINYIRHKISLANHDVFELYGQFQLTNGTKQLALTVSDNGSLVFNNRELVGTGEIQKHYVPLGSIDQEYLCGRFTTGNSTNIVVRQITSSGFIDYTTNNSDGQIIGIAKAVAGAVFVGGIGIKPQKLSGAGGTLS